MLIYENEEGKYVYIHIPKAAGKYIRTTIKKNTANKIIKEHWWVVDNLDNAHIPYILKDQFLDNAAAFKYYTYVRDPYDKIISSYKYRMEFLNTPYTITNFRNFIKKELAIFDFNYTYPANYIHYYPQYLFICDKNSDISNVKWEKIESLSPPPLYDINIYLDDESLQIINRIYDKDFELFHYKKITAITKLKCANINCSYVRHSDPDNNKGTHCCLCCMNGSSHGPLCEKIQLSRTER